MKIPSLKSWLCVFDEQKDLVIQICQYLSDIVCAGDEEE